MLAKSLLKAGHEHTGPGVALRALGLLVVEPELDECDADVDQ